MKRFLLICTLLLSSTLLAHAETAVHGDANAGKSKSTPCTACHMADGNAAVPTYPKLAGLSEKYILAQLKEFKKADQGNRNNPIMYANVQNLTEQDMADLAAFYASQSRTTGVAQDDASLQRGELLYRGGDGSKDIPACAACHGPEGKGNSLAGFPRLGGQNADYTADQLKQFHDGTRTNDANKIMQMVAANMSEDDMKAVANYIQGLH